MILFSAQYRVIEIGLPWMHYDFGMNVFMTRREILI